MCRCRCCDEPLNWIDLRLKQDDGSVEDFCYECRMVVNTIDDEEAREYVLEGAVEGVKQPFDTENY